MKNCPDCMTDENAVGQGKRCAAHEIAFLRAVLDIAHRVAEAKEVERANAVRIGCENITSREAAEERARNAERALTAERVTRVNEYARAEALIAWLRDDVRKPASQAFTEGPERQVAYEVVDLIQRMAEAKS